MLMPAFGNFHQVAWITPDLDRSIEMFREVYGIPSFFAMDQEFDAVVGERKGVMKLRFALANVDGVELELVQPKGGIDAIYRDVLPSDGSFANVFHHVCVKVNGTLEDWERHLAGLHAGRKVYLQGDVGPGARFVYTDERPFLGHYMEHVWFGPAIAKAMYEAVPRFLSKDFRG